MSGLYSNIIDIGLYEGFPWFFLNVWFFSVIPVVYTSYSTMFTL